MKSWIKNQIWRWKIAKKFDKLDKLHQANLSLFHSLEQDSLRTAKNSFNFFFHRRGWERNKNRVEKELTNIERKINHGINRNSSHRVCFV
jgi:hypothetical protein